MKVFVFGSNLAGIHGAGAALTARERYGAVIGQGKGLHGRSYAIPTKNKQFHTLNIREIQTYVQEFIAFAKTHPEMTFYLTPVGTGLAGIPHSTMALMFKDAPDNCHFPMVWSDHLKGKKFYSGMIEL